MRTGRLLALIAALGLLAVAGLAPAVAQEPAALELDALSTAEHPQVSITLSAPRALVGEDLPAEAFYVEEEGARRLVDVERLPSDDLQVLLVIDTSGSMGTAPMAAARDAAAEFVRQMPPGVQVGVLEFATQPVLVSGFSPDPQAAIQAVEGLTAGGTTALYDAVVDGLALFGDEDGVRRSIVVLSDGGDTASARPIEEAIAALEARDVVLHVVELETAESDPIALARLAGAAEGVVVSTTDPQALGDLYATVASKLTNRYLLRFRSEAHGPTLVTVGVAHSDVHAEVTRTVRYPPAPPPPPPPQPEPPPPEPAQRPGEVLALGWIGEPWVPYAGVAAVFVALALALLMILVPRKPRRRLADRGSGREASAPLPALKHVADRLVEAADRRLESRGRRGALNARLERAGVPLRPAEYVVLVGSVAAAVLALVWLFYGTLAALAAAVAVLLGSRVLLDVRARRRRAAFADQLGDSLQLLSGSLRSGYGVMQAIDAVVREADDPTAEEFRRLLVEARLGRDLDDSLEAMAQRLQIEDFDWVVQAIMIHREVGGDLAEVLDSVGETIRERDHVRRQVRTLSAEGRLSGVILVALPLVLAGAMSVVSPGYLQELLDHPVGWVLLGFGGLLIIAGALWIRRLVRLVF